MSWLAETKLAFYETWDAEVLKKEGRGFDPSYLCGEVIEDIEKADSVYKKYDLASYGWHNCLNHEFRASLKKIDKEKIWNDFLKEFKIQAEDEGDCE